MKTYNKKETHIDNSIPDDLQSVWNLSGEITQKPIVNEQETEHALDSIWNTIDDKVESKKTYTIRYLVAAVTLITAAVSFLNFFSIQKNALPGEISVIELRDGTNITLIDHSPWVKVSRPYTQLVLGARRTFSECFRHVSRPVAMAASIRGDKTSSSCFHCFEPYGVTRHLPVVSIALSLMR